MKIKLLALDMDGTIVQNLSTISNETVKAIEAVQRKGIKVTLATGREYGVTAQFARKLNITEPIICYQGGLVRNHQNGHILLDRFIPANFSRRVIKFARANKLPMLLYTLETPFAELPSPLMQDIFRQAKSPFKLVNNLLSVLNEDQLPLKFLFVQQAPKSNRVQNLLRVEFGDSLTLVKSHQSMVEATLPGVSKGTALKRLAEHLQIPLAQTMAIGDQDNDAAMLKAAGLGVAMGNASAQAKAAADVIAPPLSEDGAVWAIEKYVLKHNHA